MSCGELTETSCLEAINPFMGNFIFQEVRNITPASKALNLMFAQCKTRFLIPLDADMIVNNSFLDRVEKNISKYESKNNWHTILFPLWDTLTQEKIYALKIFNMGCMRHIPYMDDPCPDIRHFKDMTSAGLESIDLYKEDPIGDHVVSGNYFCYAKYRDLYRTLRSYPKNLLDSHFKGGKTLKDKAYKHYLFFMEQYNNGHGEHYLHCIGGMLEGITCELNHKSKDLSEKTMKYPQEQPESFLEWYRNDRSGRIFV